MSVLASAIALLAGVPLARANDGDAAGPPPMETASPGPSPRFLVHANFGVSLYTYLRQTDTLPAKTFTPSDRLGTVQQFGIAWLARRHLRLYLSALFSETLSGLPAGTSSFTNFSVIPWAAFVAGGFFTGAGPQIALRAYGKNDLDAGLFTAHGYALALGHGFLAALAVQVPVMMKQRLSVAVTPAVSLCYRF